MSYNQIEHVERASDGTLLPIDSLTVASVYSNGVISYETVVYNGHTYKKSYTWSNGTLVTETHWVKQ